MRHAAQIRKTETMLEFQTLPAPPAPWYGPGMEAWITAAVVACAIARGDVNIPRPDRAEVARVEAEAFVVAATEHVTLRTLLAVGHVESRFNPSGSQRDRDGGVWGVMQILERSLICPSRPERITWRTGRGRRHRLHVRYIHHDDPTRCTPEQTARRAQLLDPTWNIRHGASMLETFWARVHAGRYRRATVAAWVGSYYVGSVPARRREMRQYLQYARRVRRAEGVMQRRLEQCRRGALLEREEHSTEDVVHDQGLQRSHPPDAEAPPRLEPDHHDGLAGGPGQAGRILADPP